MDIYAWADPLDKDFGINTVRSSFAPLDVFLNREDALSILADYQNRYDGEEGELFINDFVNYLLRHSGDSVNYYVDPITGFNCANVYTPNGSAVMVYVGLTWSDVGTTGSVAAVSTANYAAQYDAEVLAPANPSYNCHSYAWYSTSTTNQYWMEHPQRYTEDGSYVLGDPVAGNIITYFSPSALLHSGIVDYPLFGIIRSKWGYLGVFKHVVSSCPYYSSPDMVCFWGSAQ